MAWYEWLMAGVILAGTGGVVWVLYGKGSGPTDAWAADAVPAAKRAF